MLTSSFFGMHLLSRACRIVLHDMFSLLESWMAWLYFMSDIAFFRTFDVSMVKFRRAILSSLSIDHGGNPHLFEEIDLVHFDKVCYCISVSVVISKLTFKRTKICIELSIKNAT